MRPPDKQAEEVFERLKEESRRELRRTTARAGLALILSSLVLAAVFMVFLYISPKKEFDILLAAGAVAISIILFFWGLKNYLDL